MSPPGGGSGKNFQSWTSSPFRFLNLRHNEKSNGDQSYVYQKNRFTEYLNDQHDQYYLLWQRICKHKKAFGIEIKLEKKNKP